MRDITERKYAEKKLQTAHKELEQKVKERTASLEELNAALKVLLKKRDEDKVELEDKILFNMKELIDPVLEKLEKSRLDERQKTLLGILGTNLNDIVSPFVQGVSIKNLRLTPTEIQVANLIKQGKSTKEIAGLLYSSESAIIFHRHNIRKKLGLISQKINLRSFLQTIQ
jgi:DNA-binding CsgD family transcriptional regulator